MQPNIYISNISIYTIIYMYICNIVYVHIHYHTYIYIYIYMQPIYIFCFLGLHVASIIDDAYGVLETSYIHKYGI